MKYGAYFLGVGAFSDPNLLAELAHEAQEEGRARLHKGPPGI